MYSGWRRCVANRAAVPCPSLSAVYGEPVVSNVPVVSVDTAALVTDTSKRTLWRRLSAGKLQRHSMDEQGRVMLAFSDIQPQLCVAFSTPPAGGGLMTFRCL